MMQFISKLLSLACLLMMPLTISAKKQMPDFRSGFQLLESNFRIYRAYGDSIHAKMDEADWVNMMGRRAELFRKMYSENNRVIKEITDYFQQEESKIPNAAYDSLFVCVKKSFDGYTLDNFLVEQFSQILLPHYEAKGDTAQLVIMRHIAGLCNVEIARFQDHDAGLTAKAYLEANLRLADKAATLSNTVMQTLPLDFMNYCYTLASIGFVFPSEALAMTKRFEHFVADTESKVTRQMNSRWQNFLNILRSRSSAIYMHTDVNTKEDSLAVKEMLANSSYSTMQMADLKTLEDTVFYCQYKCEMKELSVQEADRIVYTLTQKLFDEIEAEPAITENHIQLVSNVFLASVQLMDDNSDVAYEMRTLRVSSLCKRLVSIVQRTHITKDPFFLEGMLGRLACMQRIFKYLPADEKISFMEELAVKSQIGTIMHVGTVDRLAMVVFEGLLRHCPDQFLGVMGINTVEELNANKEKLKQWVGRAAAYHDLGKIGISPIFNDDFRRLTDREFRLSRLHPELALTYLDVDSLFYQFKDVALGHHKWFNGKGGYPSSFDNTQSPWRAYIDLVTLCDCIDAATDNLNRNYRKSKTLSEVLLEFKRDAGTVYNPVMVEALASDKKLCQRVEYIITKQRYERLKDVRSRFLK